MKTRFIVIHEKGPAWDPSKLRRSQRQWDEHAEFMDKLTAEGFVVLGACWVKATAKCNARDRRT